MSAVTSRDLIVLLGAALAMAATPDPAGAVTVRVDQNAVVNLKTPAGSVLVGNPSIADVSLITPQRVAILGRAYGLTNVIITDRMGHTIFQQEVNVTPASTGRISLYRGALVSNFACSPRCERTPMPGEEKTTNYEAYSPPFRDYGDRARSETGGQGGGGGSP